MFESTGSRSQVEVSGDTFNSQKDVTIVGLVMADADLFD